MATLDGALHVDEEMAHLAEALLHSPVDTPEHLRLLEEATRAYGEAVLARKPTHPNFTTFEEIMELCEWGRLVSESSEIVRAVEVRLYASRLDTELTSFLQAATEGIQPMSTVQLGRQLTACQDALDKAGRLLALQAKATAYGGPSADVEQQLHTALDQVTRTALVAADAAAAYVAGHAEQQRLDGV